MFSREDFDRLSREASTNHYFVGTYPGLYFNVFPQFAFREPASEQYARITRAPKQAGDNGLKFWATAEIGEKGRNGLPTELIANFKFGEFRALSEEEFNALVASQCAELIVPPTLPLHSPHRFVAALAMYTLKTDFTVSLIAEYEDEFIHFYWDTTA
jgi:hypothetical protein